jgi:carboxylesterase type B
MPEDRMPPRAAMEVRTESGTVSGSGADVIAYKGIPYAAPPVGSLRWKPPQKAPSWSGVRECASFGDDPVQNPQPDLRGPKTSEDCLALNIWTPIERANPLPVMVWFYGGAFAGGSGSMPMYGGEALARKRAVVVSVNYRVGVLGFLAHPGLTAESPNHSSGNYGLLDQIAALKWVRENIAGFGGDPNCVTIFGESAGGGSVAVHLLSPLSRGLFHRAIIQSAPVMRGRCDLATAEKAGLDAMGADLAALRAAPAAELLAKNMAVVSGNRALIAPRPLSPIQDGWLLTEPDRAAFTAGHYQKVPLMIGAVEYEGAFFVANMPIKDVVGYRTFVQGGMGKWAEETLALYPAAADAEVPNALATLLADLQIHYGTRAFPRVATSHGQPVYRYFFTQRTGGGDKPPTHVEEVPYVFGTLEASYFGRQRAIAAKDRALSEAMMGAWVRFAVSGDPNGGDLSWPAYDPAKDNYLVLGDPIGQGAGWRTKHLDFCERVIAAG